MFRDLTTSKGLPLANWDKATYDHAAGFLETRFQLSREWFYDLNSYGTAELVGGSIGILAVVFQWNRADTESFQQDSRQHGRGGGPQRESAAAGHHGGGRGQSLPEGQNGQ